MNALSIITLILMKTLTAECESVKILNIDIKWTNRGTQTDFSIQSALGNGLALNNAWLGFGFNNQMNSANVIICKSISSGSSIEHYYNINFNSNLLLASNPTVGITNATVQILNGILVCSFTRDNSNSATNYFRINSQSTSFMIAGYGSYLGQSNIAIHLNKGVSSAAVTFIQSATSTTTTTRLIVTSTTSTSAVTTTTKPTTISTTTTTTTTKPVTTTATTVTVITTSSTTTRLIVTSQSTTLTSGVTTTTRPTTKSTLLTTLSTPMTTRASTTITTTRSTSLATTNLCSPNPCSYGICKLTQYSYTCDCFPGFNGANCDSYINACISYPCKNGATCFNTGNSFICKCLAGFSDFNCQTNFVCNPNPCRNEGTCVLTGSTTAICECKKGFSGGLCQDNVCTRNPCQNSGICTLSNHQYKCTCQNGFTGFNCETAFNPCSVNNSPVCLNNGKCTINLSIFPFYECQCGIGFFGSRCQNGKALASTINNCVDVDFIRCQYYSNNKYCFGNYFINGVTVPKYCPKSCNMCN